jgi:hypothetical protein
LLAKYGLDADGIHQKVKETIEILEERKTNLTRLKSTI